VVDSQKKYLDKVVNLLVRDTRIDYGEKEITYTFIPFSKFKYNSIAFSFFSKYCKETYGIGENEIEYVWVEYKDIIKEKMKW
jgi:hypothetical protein